MNLAIRQQHADTFELSPIKAIELEASKIPDVVSLAQGVPTLPVFEQLHSFVIEQIKQKRCDRYSLTNGLPELREAISASMLEEEGLRYDSDNELIVTCGSIEGICASLLALTSPGDEVIVPTPTYASYMNCIKLARCTPRYVELDEEKNFDFDIKALEKQITSRTRVLLFCLPNNPTGTIYSEGVLKQLVALAERHNLFLLVDEVYKDFYYGDERHFSPLQVEGARERTVRICSFSKAFAITGWRVGFLCAEQTIANDILRFHDAMVTCAPVPSQYAGIAALKYGNEFLEWASGQYKERRDYAISRLDSLSPYFDYQIPRAGYFVFPRLKDSVPLSRDSRRFVHELLHQKGVALVFGAAFGPSGEGHVRMNFGREIAELETAFDRIEEFMHGKTTRKASGVKIADPAPNRSRVKAAIHFSLRKLASSHLRRSKDLVVGIVGIKSKTLFKREISRSLERDYNLKPGILSYNTLSGLPLSILQLKSPKSLGEAAYFFFQLFAKALWTKKSHRGITLLEFSASDSQQARKFLEIVTPDILIVTPSFPSGPNVDAMNQRDALEVFVSKTTPENTLLCTEGYSEDFVSLVPEKNHLQSKPSEMRDTLATRCAELLGARFASKLKVFATSTSE